MNTTIIAKREYYRLGPEDTIEAGDVRRSAKGYHHPVTDYHVGRSPKELRITVFRDISRLERVPVSKTIRGEEYSEVSEGEVEDGDYIVINDKGHVRKAKKDQVGISVSEFSYGVLRKAEA